MSGMYPNSGVPAADAQNSVNVATTGCGGDAGELFHSTQRCTPRFDPAAANAVMSEILNAVTSVCEGTPSTEAVAYDCSKLTNLSEAICRKIVQVLQYGCYDFDDIGTECEVTQLGWIQEDDGCGRIVKVTQDPLPRGFQSFRDGVAGTTPTVITGNAAQQSALLNAQFGGAIRAYPIVGSGSVVTLDRDDFCGLSTAGTRMAVEVYSNVGYWMEMQSMTLRNLGPYQWGIALVIDGVVRSIDTDCYAVDKSGNNNFLASTRGVNFVTTGTDMVIEVIPFLRVDESGPAYNVGDLMQVDMTQTTVRWDTRT